MDVFPSVERRDPSAARNGEALYEFLQRVDSAYFDQVRTLINGWATEVPGEARGDIVRRVQSNDDRTSWAAFWELYLHEGFRRLGFRLTPHPDVPGSPRHPDFLAERGEVSFYIEATIAGGEDDEGEAKRRNRVYDLINDRVDSPDFFLWIDVATVGQKDPPAGPLVAGIHDWLSRLSWDQLHAAFGEGLSMLDVEPWAWKYDDWELEFRPVPKSDDARGEPGLRPIGVSGPATAKFVDDASPVRSSVRKKSSRYGDLDRPMLVAIRHMTFGADYVDVANALFGSEAVQMTGPGPEDYRMVRQPDGAWLGPHGLQHRRCSAVLLARGLHPWTPSTCDLSLWHHPEPYLPLQLDDGPWTTKRVVDGRLKDAAPTIPLAAMLELGDPWPSGELDIE